MNKTHAVICYSDHHIQKSLLLKKKFLSEIVVFYVQNSVLRKFGDNQPLAINNKLISNFDSFIFFALAVNAVNIKLCELVHQQKKQIIAFQESNQLEMHHGDVNNLILNAHLIIAASKKERIELIKNYYYQEQQVKSFGWLFNEDLDFRKNLLADISDDILLILSAPNYITASSYETFSFRKKLIEALISLHPDNRLLIKPHPLEDFAKTSSLIQSFRKNNFQIKLLNKKQDFNNILKQAKTIYASNRSQASIDLIDSGKIILYKLGPNNFLTEHGLKYSDEFQKNKITFINLSSKKCVSSFKERYINSKNSAFKSVEYAINNFSSNADPVLIFKQEIYQWKFLYGAISKATLHKFFKENSLFDEINILENPEQITCKNFESLEKNFSIRTSFFLIYVRAILRDNIEINENIEEILKKNITRWFTQYHSIDSINLYYYLKNQNLEKNIIKRDSLALILNTIKIDKEKSLVMKIFFNIQDSISTMDGVNKRLKCFHSVNFAWNILRKNYYLKIINRNL